MSRGSFFGGISLGSRPNSVVVKNLGVKDWLGKCLWGKWPRCNCLDTTVIFETKSTILINKKGALLTLNDEAKVYDIMINSMKFDQKHKFISTTEM